MRGRTLAAVAVVTTFGVLSDARPSLLESTWLTVPQRDATRLWSTVRSASVSGDGRYVAFISYARLSVADEDSMADIYVLDRTTTTVTLESRLVATVAINPRGDFTELLAHELEHVIEQLDGIDLAVKASVANSGVRSCVDGTFETSRAVRVGSVVAVQARR